MIAATRYPRLGRPRAKRARAASVSEGSRCTRPAAALRSRHCSIRVMALVCCLLWLCIAAPRVSPREPASGAPSEAGNPQSATAGAAIVFIKEFPGSYPPYFSVTVSDHGEAVYRTTPDDPQPVKFQLSPALTRTIFDAAARLNYFQDGRFEANRKVAAMGKKTLRYESDGQRHEATFNYSENRDAMAFAALFDKISITEQHLLSLERLVRFDRLGVNKGLLYLEISLNRRELVQPDQFAPVLERIADDARFVNVARHRAADLLHRIRNGNYSPRLQGLVKNEE